MPSILIIAPFMAYVNNFRKFMKNKKNCRQVVKS